MITAVVGRDEHGRLVELDAVDVGPDEEVLLLPCAAGVIAVVGQVASGELGDLEDLLSQLR